MKIPVSVVQFVRKSLKIRGASIHSGRGWIDMHHDCEDKDELADRICDAQCRWIRAGIIDAAVQTGNVWQIVFKPHTDPSRDQYYRTLCYNAVTNRLFVTMTV